MRTSEAIAPGTVGPAPLDEGVADLCPRPHCHDCANRRCAINCVAMCRALGQPAIRSDRLRRLRLYAARDACREKWEKGRQQP